MIVQLDLPSWTTSLLPMWFNLMYAVQLLPGINSYLLKNMSHQFLTQGWLKGVATPFTALTYTYALL